jgi:hypothetical protein
MASLRELQGDFRAALLGGDDAAAAAAVVDDAIGAAARLSVYRHHVFTSLTAALEATFPVVCRLVDRRFFGWLADRYIRAHPPTTPCLFEYGADFADFIAAFPACEPLPYLSDVARLEWAMNAALHAPDAVALGPEALAGVDGASVLELDASLTLVPSPWPVDAIWRANQPGAEPGVVDAESRGARLEVRRLGQDVVFRTLPVGTFAFRATLAARGPLATAVERALELDAALDVATELRSLFDDAVVVRVDGSAAAAR